MRQSLSGKEAPFACLVAHDDRQWNADLPPLPLGDVPGVGILNVREDNLLHIDLLLCLCRDGA